MMDWESRQQSLKHGLASIQGSFEAVQQLRAQIVKLPDNFREGIQLDPLNEAFVRVKAGGDRLAEVINNLAEMPQNALTALEDRTQETVDLGERLISETVARFNETTEQLETTHEAIAQAFESALESTLVQMDDLNERLVAFTEDEIEAKTTELTEHFKETLEGAIEDQWEKLDGVGTAIVEKIEEDFEMLIDTVSDEVEQTIKDEIESILDDAVQMVQDEVNEAIITSQMQVQLSSLIAPYLPQLMVVRTTASSIQSALEIMRMGV